MDVSTQLQLFPTALLRVFADPVIALPRPADMHIAPIQQEYVAQLNAALEATLAPDTQSVKQVRSSGNVSKGVHANVANLRYNHVSMHFSASCTARCTADASAGYEKSERAILQVAKMCPGTLSDSADKPEHNGKGDFEMRREKSTCSYCLNLFKDSATCCHRAPETDRIRESEVLEEDCYCHA